MMDITNKDGILNIMMEEYDEFYDFISRLRYILGIIVTRRKDIRLLINVPHHLNDIEIKELEETMRRFEINDFVCIN